MASHDRFTLANERAKRPRYQTAKVVSAHYDRKAEKVVVHLSSKLVIDFSPGDVQGLEGASPSQLDLIEISPSGLGLHFPAVDADVSVPGLLEGSLGSRSWMAPRLAE